MIGGILLINCAYVYINKNKIAIEGASIIEILYSISDEPHQLSVDGKRGKITDVVIDLLGIFTGITDCLINVKIMKIIVDRLNRK